MTNRPHPAAIDVNGSWYLSDAKGSLVPIGMVKAEDLLMDELVRAMTAKANWLSAALSAFKLHAFEGVGEFQALLAQQYDASIGGKKGNITLTSYDGCAKIQIAVSDLVELGPELQVAKQLIDECLREWSAESRDEIRALVDRVFAVDKEGQISHAGLFMLLRVGITDERWLRGMKAIRDSMRVIGSRTYVRFYDRPTPDGAWRPITMDLASA
ncbi:DUF3164 family protein [Sphingomonas aurantiaca]|uniref:DUF3164 family protein n=1 Tax=Sphingomonas aurantiaca TaxID=185949 RepID=UPI002FDFE486